MNGWWLPKLRHGKWDLLGWLVAMLVGCFTGSIQAAVYAHGTLLPGSWQLNGSSLPPSQYLGQSLGVELGFYLPWGSNKAHALTLASELGQGLNRFQDTSFMESFDIQKAALRYERLGTSFMAGIGVSSLRLQVHSFISQQSSTQLQFSGYVPEFVVGYRFTQDMIAPWFYAVFSSGAVGNLSIQSLQMGARLQLSAGR